MDSYQIVNAVSDISTKRVITVIANDETKHMIGVGQNLFWFMYKAGSTFSFGEIQSQIMSLLNDIELVRVVYAH